MNTVRDYETTYTPYHRVETLDFQRARERARRQRRKLRNQRILGVILIILGAITIPLCEDITPFAFTVLLGGSTFIP